MKTKKHSSRQRATMAVRQQCSKGRSQLCRLHSIWFIPRSLAAHSALCPVRLLLYVLLCCCEMWAGCWLWDVCAGCVACGACIQKIKKLKRVPYRYEGFIGAGDRGKKPDREKPSRFVGFGLFFQPKNRKIKVGFRLVGKTDKKTTERNEFWFSVHNTGSASSHRHPTARRNCRGDNIRQLPLYQVVESKKIAR